MSQFSPTYSCRPNSPLGPLTGKRPHKTRTHLPGRPVNAKAPTPYQYPQHPHITGRQETSEQSSYNFEFRVVVLIKSGGYHISTAPGSAERGFPLFFSLSLFFFGLTSLAID